MRSPPCAGSNGDRTAATRRCSNQRHCSSIRRRSPRGHAHPCASAGPESLAHVLGAPAHRGPARPAPRLEDELPVRVEMLRPVKPAGDDAGRLHRPAHTAAADPVRAGADGRRRLIPEPAPDGLHLTFVTTVKDPQYPREGAAKEGHFRRGVSRSAATCTVLGNDSESSRPGPRPGPTIDDRRGNGHFLDHLSRRDTRHRTG